MDSPKVSVLIPLYNRKHYIKECINSVLRQTFQDFEIIIRDNCSTDGSYDFVAQTYAKEIESGKIKLARNQINIGEFPNCNRLITAASGKYFTVLHSDDLYLPHALQHLYEVAENTNADVVHASWRLDAPPVITEGTQLLLCVSDQNPARKNLMSLPYNPVVRLGEWLKNGTFLDCQYNIYNRKFILDNNLFFDQMSGISLNLFLLKWLMTAKVYIKTPIHTYINRNAPDSFTHDSKKFSYEKDIAEKLESVQRIDRLLDDLAFFRDKDDLRQLVKIKLLFPSNYKIRHFGIYRDGITPELHKNVENTFRKYFGDNALYPTTMFHLINLFNLLVPKAGEVESKFWDMCLEMFFKKYEESPNNAPPSI